MHYKRLAVCLILVTLAGQVTSAQQRSSKTKETLAPEILKPDAELLRLKAVSLLNTLDQDVASVESVPERVAVLAEIGDALWSVDEEHARAVLTRSFQEIDKVSGDTRADPERLANQVQSLRRLVLARVARHDPALANRLARNAPKAAVSEEQKWSQRNYGATSPSSEALLGVAQSLLGTDQKQAVALARYALADGITQRFRLFLSALSARDAAAADELAEFSLNVASRTHPGRLFDALILWDYAFQPESFYLGGVSWNRESKTRHVAPRSLKRAVLAFAVTAINENAQQLAPAAANAGETAHTQAQPVLLYSVIQQLLPAIQSEFPEGALTVQQALARAEQELSLAGQKPPQPPVSDANEETPASLVERLLEKAAATAQGEARDDLYLDASFKLMQQREYERAAEIAAKIDDPTRREMILEPLNFNLAGKAIEKGEIEEGLRYARRLKAPELQVTALAQAGKSYFDKGDIARANEALSEAQTIVSKAGSSDELPAATLNIAAAFLKNDSFRAFEAIAQAIKQANKMTETRSLWALLSSSNTSGPLAISNYNWKSAESGGLSWVKSAPPRLTGLTELLSKAAQFDFERAISLSKEFKEKGLSLVLQASICRAVIESSRAKTQSRQSK